MGKLITGIVRLSYLAALEPKLDQRNNKKYGCLVMMPKSDKAGKKALDKAIQEAFEEGKGLLGIKSDKMPSSLKIPLRDGDEDDDENLHGHWVFNCSGNSKPGIIDRHKEPIEDPDEVYSGMFARLSLTIKAYNNEGKGITAYLNNIQKIKDGPRLDGRASAASEFDEFELDEEDDDSQGW